MTKRKVKPAPACECAGEVVSAAVKDANKISAALDEEIDKRVVGPISPAPVSGQRIRNSPRCAARQIGRKVCAWLLDKKIDWKMAITGRLQTGHRASLVAVYDDGEVTVGGKVVLLPCLVRWRIRRAYRSRWNYEAIKAIGGQP